MSPSPPLSPDSVAINLFGFDFGVTIQLGMDWDRLCLPHKFTLIVDGKDPHEIVLRVAIFLLSFILLYLFASSKLSSNMYAIYLLQAN
jgi:hypothetical protein